MRRNLQPPVAALSAPSPLSAAMAVVAAVALLSVAASLTSPRAGPDFAPDPFSIPLGLASLTPGAQAPSCAYVDSAPVVPTGLRGTTTITAVSTEAFRYARISVAGGPFMASPAQIGPGQSFVIRIAPLGALSLPAAAMPRAVALVAIGGVAASYAIRCHDSAAGTGRIPSA